MQNRIVKVDVFPLGIDYEKYAGAPADEEVKTEIGRIRDTVGGRQIILSIDRLDYTKGIVERLEAFDWFLSTWPQYKGRVTLIIVAVPSRTGIEDYQQLRERLSNSSAGTTGIRIHRLHARLVPLTARCPSKRLTALTGSGRVPGERRCGME